MGCGCSGGSAQTYKYTDSQGNVFTGQQIQMRALQIKDQRSNNASGTLELLQPAATGSQ